MQQPALCKLCLQDLSRAFRAAEALQYGMVGVNEVAITSEVAPFGGVKHSGMGRWAGAWGFGSAGVGELLPQPWQLHGWVGGWVGGFLRSIYLTLATLPVFYPKRGDRAAC